MSDKFFHHKLPPKNLLETPDISLNVDSPVYLVINGPNLNMLGTRDPRTYGTTTLADIESSLEAKASELGVAVYCVHSNYEGYVLDIIHQSVGKIQGIIINAGGWTHTSVALADALTIPGVPIIEVHISQVHAREDFRKKSYISPISKGLIAGLGAFGYLAALEYLVSINDQPQAQ